MDSEPSVNGFEIRCSLPTVRAPANGCACEHFDSQISSGWDCPNLLVEPPGCEFGASRLYLISSDRLWGHVEDFSFADGSCELDVFRVRPDEGHSGSSGAAVVKSSLGNVFRLPYLFWNESSRAGLSLDHMYEALSFLNLSLSYFIVGSFPGEERPASSDTSPIERGAVVVFAVAVQVVPMPDRACPSLFSESRVYHLDGVEDPRVLS